MNDLLTISKREKDQRINDKNQRKVYLSLGVNGLRQKVKVVHDDVGSRKLGRKIMHIVIYS